MLFDFESVFFVSDLAGTLFVLILAQGVPQRSVVLPALVAVQHS